MTNNEPIALWAVALVGYALAVVTETPVLVLGLSPRHNLSRRILAGILLTAASYPIVAIVLPFWISDRVSYVIAAELFAVLSECALFWVVFIRGHGYARDAIATTRDFASIIFANIASYGAGVLWFGP